MIPKKYSKIFAIGIFFFLATSAFIPIAHASTRPPEEVGGRVTRSQSQPAKEADKTGVLSFQRSASAPESSVRSRLLTEEPIPVPSHRSSGPHALSEAPIPFTQSAGFIPIGQHQSSQIDGLNTQAAIARLESDIMKDDIIPHVEGLLKHTWRSQPIPTIAIKDDLMAVVSELKAGKPQQAAALAATLIEKVNAAETTGSLDEFSRLALYSVQTVLHLLAGTPYTALNNFLELRQLGISWHSSSGLISRLFKDEGEFYEDMTRFVSSDKAVTIWGEDERIRKLWQGHAQFASDQSSYKDISQCLDGLGDTACAEGELTFRHTLYVLGKMLLRFGEPLNDATTAEPLLAASEQTLRKIAGYRFEGLFSYRNAAIKAFLGDAAWARYKLERQMDYLNDALTYYTDAIPFIEATNETGASMIKSSFNHAEDIIEAYGDLSDDSVSEKIIKLGMLREALISLKTESLPHIDIPMLQKTIATELIKLMPENVETDPQYLVIPIPKSSEKKRKNMEDSTFGEESQQVDFGFEGFNTLKKTPAKKKK